MTLYKLDQVLARRKFNRYLPLQPRKDFQSYFLPYCKVLPVTLQVRACRDPRDDKFLALAQAGNAAAIVTGDDDLHALREWQGIPILNPAEFLEYRPPTK